MATFLDITLTQYFSSIFVFLFVFVLAYSVLQYVKFLGDNKALNSILSLALAFFTLFSDSMTNMITSLAPVFVVAMVFIALLLMIYGMFGMSGEWLQNLIQGEDNTLRYFILVIGFIILLSVIAQAFGPQLLSFTGGSEGGITSNIGSAIFHPKVLGMLFIFFIATFSIMMLTKAKL